MTEKSSSGAPTGQTEGKSAVIGATNERREHASLSRLITVGLVIDDPWISKIINGEKTWEMRSRRTHKRERIALIQKGSGQIVGIATITGVKGPLGDDEVAASFNLHRVPTQQIGDWRYAWIMANIRKLRSPVSYVHARGAVTWVKLNQAAIDAINAADTDATPV